MDFLVPAPPELVYCHESTDDLSATHQRRRRRDLVVPLVRAPRRLPKILEPDEVNKLFRALRHHRDRDEWLADQYQRAAHLIDASMAQAVAE